MGVSPQSLEKTGTLKGSTLDQSAKTLKKGDGSDMSLRRMFLLFASLCGTSCNRLLGSETSDGLG